MEDKDASASHEPVQTAQVDMVVDGQTSEIVPDKLFVMFGVCLLYTSPSPRDATLSRMPSSA